MLTIRNAQLAVLAEARFEHYVDELAGLVARHWPEEFSAMGMEGARRLAEDAVVKAERYEIRGEAEVARYLNLMLALGRDFDRDPRYPWAGAILRDEAIAPRHKLKKLIRLAAEALAAAEAG